MFQDMTEAQIVLLVGSLGNGLLAGWTAWTVWKDRRDARVHKELMEIKADERDVKEREHRHKMAEIQQMQMFELEKMGRMVTDAKAVAVETKRDIGRKIEESQTKRSAEFIKLEAKVDHGMHVANGYKELIADAVEGSRQLREDFQSGNVPNAVLAAKSVELQKEGNETLEEIAQNTAQTPKPA